MTASIIVNGQPEPLAAATVMELVRAKGVDPAKPGAAVAVNGQVVPRARWAETPLASADRVEIVRPYAGG